jgi:hypothetical protein
LKLAFHHSGEPIVGIFERRQPAEACVRALHDTGFDPSQVGFAGPDIITATPVPGDFHAGDAMAAAATGSLAGGLVGGALGAVLAGLVPGIGPIIAGGMLAGIAAGAPAGAAIGGIGAALEAAGVAPLLADYCEGQVRAGRSLVTIHGDRPLEAARIVALHGGRVEDHVGRAVSRATGTSPEPPNSVEGSFASEAVAEAVADQLRAAFPDREVTVEDGDAPHRVKVRQRTSSA